MNGADLAVLVVPFLDGSSNRVEAGTDLEGILEVISFVTQSDFFARQMFSTHSILCVGYLKSFLLSHSQISLLARCFPHTLFCVLDT